MENNINNDVINLDASASGIISGALNTQKLNIHVTSSSFANISGTTNDMLIDASSCAVCNTKKLICKNAEVDASSIATVYVNSSGSLNAAASSMAKVYYFENPINVVSSTSSMGEIIKK